MSVKTRVPLIGISDSLQNSNHQKTQYQVAQDSGFNTVVYDSGELTKDLNEHQVPQGNLNKGNTYFARSRVRHKNGLWSNWSSGFEFSIVQPGNVINSFSAPGSSPYGVIVDSNGNLISSDYDGAGTIYVHDGISSTTTNSFSSPDNNPQELTIDSNDNLISIDNNTNKIYIYQGISSTVTSSFSSPDNNPFGLAIDSNGNLISGDFDGAGKIYIHQGISATTTSSFNTPGGNPKGLTIDSSGNLISADASTNPGKIYIHQGISSTITSNFNSPGGFPLGLAIDSNGNLIVIALDSNSNIWKFYIVEF